MTEQKKPIKRESYFVGMRRRRIKEDYYLRLFNRRYEEKLTQQEYNKAIDEVTQFLVDAILNGTLYKLPRQTGYMFIRARKRGLDAKPKIAFGSTVKARKETGDPNVVIYVRNDIPALKLSWFSTGVKVPSKVYTLFRPAKTVKKRILQAALQKKSYIILNDIKKNINRQSNTGSADGSGLPTDSVRDSGVHG